MKILDRLIDLGVADAPLNEQKQVRVVNAIAVVSHALNAPFVLLLIPGLSESAPVIGVQLFALGGWTLAMVLQHAGHRMIARWTAIASATAHIVMACWLVGDVAPVWPILATLVLVPFLIFPAHHRAHMVAAAVCVVTAEVVTWQLFANAPPRVSLDPTSARALALAVPPTLGLFPALLGIYYHVITTRMEEALAAEQARSEQLLLNVLPASIAVRLKAGEKPIADRFEHVSVLFSDIVGFTKISEKTPPAELVAILDDMFSAFDGEIARLGLEKIKTIGDAYMVASGVPTARPDHVEAIVELALAMTRIMDERVARTGLSVRIGIHTGPVVAGVIGEKKFSYDLWGDTVNTASRMESHGLPGRVHVSAAVAERLAGNDRYVLEPRGTIEVKGKGAMQTFLVSRR
jgi:class 3 adenylate cyclase